MSAIAGTTALVVGLLAVAVFVAIAAERLRLPAEVALVAFGAAVAAVHPVAAPFAFGDTLLFVFLPPLIFEAAWSIDPAVLRRSAARIAVLALPGTLFVALAIAALVALTGQLPFAAALVLGAIVSPTDPVAVIAIFRRLPVPAALQTLVEGESIANDGVAIVLFGIAVAFATGSTFAPGPAFLGGLLAVAGGIAVGTASGALVAYAIGRTAERATELAATVVLAFGAYLCADALGWSGVFATAAAGITLRARRAFERDESEVDAFWAAVAFVANAFVFLATGLQLEIARILRDPVVVATAVGAVVATRIALAAAVVRPFAWTATVVLAGMRGGLSLALALALPATLPGRGFVIDAVYGVVLFTLVVQGLTLEPVLRRLGFQSGSGGPP